MAERDKPELPPIVVGALAGKEQTRPGQYLSVDETKRPRANSDPVGLHFAISILPEITVTSDDGDENGSNEDDEVDNFLVPPSPRPRANTCPEDMFQQRKERPPTPPPTDIIAKSPINRKNRFNFCHNTKDFNGISFVHHKLCKVSEDGGSGGNGGGGGGVFPNRINGHRRHSTGRRASCLASLSESSGLLEEEENENEVLAPGVSIFLSHSMDSLSMSTPDSVKTENNQGVDTDGNNGQSSSRNNNKDSPSNVLSNCSGKKCSDSNGHNVITSNSSIR